MVDLFLPATNLCGIYKENDNKSLYLTKNITKRIITLYKPDCYGFWVWFDTSVEFCTRRQTGPN